MPQNKTINYYLKYNLIKIKRFTVHNVLIFAFQFLIIINLNFEYPALPMHPPIGVAFVMFYLFGTNALLGLLLSECLGYFAHGLSNNSILLNLFSDLFAGYLGAFLCKNIYFFNINYLVKLNKQNLLEFIKKNAFITCSISSLIKTFAIILIYKSYDPKILLCNYIALWLSDLNAILIISSCILSWTYIIFNQDNISNKSIQKYFVIMLVFFIILSVLFMKKFELIYLIITAIIIAIYFGYYYGYLIARLLLFIIGSVYLTYFIRFKNQYILYFGNVIYIIIPTILLLFAICMLLAGLIDGH